MTCSKDLRNKFITILCSLCFGELLELSIALIVSLLGILLIAYHFFSKKSSLIILVSLFCFILVCIVIFLFCYLPSSNLLYSLLLSPAQFSIFQDTLLILSISFLGIGYFYKARFVYIIRILGWQFFGFYWLFFIPYYMFLDDPIAIIFLTGGISFFTALSYHEFVCFKKNSKNETIDFLMGIVFFTSVVYFSFAKIPILGGILIKIVADQSALFLNIFNYKVSAGGIVYVQGMMNAPAEVDIIRTGIEPGQRISIILACTGIEAMAIFIGAILCSKAQKKKKLITFMATIPVIWVLNLLRNAAIIYITYEKIFGEASFEISHVYLGKLGSFIILIGLVFVTFKFLPDVRENISSIFDLGKIEYK